MSPKTRWLVPAAVCAAAIGIGACGTSDSGDSSSTTASGSSGSGKIGFLLPETETARYETQDKPLFEAAVKDQCPDCEVLYQNADQDTTKQQSQVEAMVTQGVDVIVLDPVDSTSAAGMVQRAEQENIPVISYDRLILNADLAAYAEFNSSEVGKQQGEALAKKLDEDGNPTGPIVQINGDPKDNNAKLFKEGASAVFTDKNIDVAKNFDTPDWLPENAQREMEQSITALGRDSVVGVLSANDGMAAAIISVLKKHHLNGQVPVTGQDASIPGLQAVLNGDQCVTIWKPTQPEAATAANLAVALFKGQKPSADDKLKDPESGKYIPSKLLDPTPVLLDNGKMQDVIDSGQATFKQICTAAYADLCREHKLKAATQS